MNDVIKSIQDKSKYDSLKNALRQALASREYFFTKTRNLDWELIEVGTPYKTKFWGRIK